MTPGVKLIEEERQRQIDEEGWDEEHDRVENDNEQLRWAAVAYLTGNKQHWPWDMDWYKPSDNTTRNLQKAGALIAAEIDRRTRS